MADKVKTRDIPVVYRKLVAPGWAGDEWQANNVAPVKFDENDEAWVKVSEDGQPTSVVILDGKEVPLIPVEGAPNLPLPRGFTLTDETKTVKVAVAAD